MKNGLVSLSVDHFIFCDACSKSWESEVLNQFLSANFDIFFIGFREIISLISMLLSKTDFSITKNYDDLLVDPDLMSLGNEVRNKLVETRQAVIDVSGAKDISGPHIQLMRASSIIRNPYVDSINVVQAEILKVLRNMPEDDSPDLTPELKAIKSVRNDALLLSIKGIAQGMKNSG